MAVQPHRTTFVPRTEEIKRLMVKNGLTVEALARQAPVSTKTLKRILSGNEAHITTFAKIAKPLGVTPDLLIENDRQPNESPPSVAPRKSMKISIELDVPFDDFDETTDPFAFLKALVTLAGTKGTITIGGITPGSTIIALEMDEADAAEVLTAFAEKRLRSLRVVSIRVPKSSDLAQIIFDPTQSAKERTFVERLLIQLADSAIQAYILVAIVLGLDPSSRSLIVTRLVKLRELLGAPTISISKTRDDDAFTVTHNSDEDE